MTPRTRQWAKKAEEDWRFILLFKNAVPASHDAVCFHCQLSAEKYLKGLLQERGKTPRRGFDLGRLLCDVESDEPTIDVSRRGLSALTKFGDDLRYHDAIVADARKSRMAMRLAERVRTEIRGLLGLKETKRKKP